MSFNCRRRYALSAALAALAAGSPTLIAQDCNLNGIPDTCDLSCGELGGPCDVDGCGQHEDCNVNGVPDECDSPTHDDNGNGIIDACELVVDSVKPCGRFFIFPAVPWPINVNGAVRAFDRSANPRGVFLNFEVHTVTGAAFDRAGNLIITQSNESELIVMDRDGDIVQTITGGGLSSAQGVAIDGAGNIATGSFLTDSVEFFAPDGTHLGELRHAGTVEPKDVAYDRSGNLFGAARNNPGSGRVAVFDSDLNFVRYIGQGQFFPQPLVMAFDQDENLFVTTGGRVQKFNHEGTLLTSLTHPDLDPHGVAVDESNLVYVTNKKPFEVFVFDVDGVLLDRLPIDVGAFPHPELWLLTITFDVFPERDCNENGTSDACDIEAEDGDDCNFNGTPDQCELAGNDCNGDNVPDNCEADCNGNGVPDECEIAAGTATDCQPNGVPDACDLGRGGVSFDVDFNRVPDECQVCTEVVRSSGPLVSLQAVAINSQPIEPTNCLTSSLGDLIEAEFFVSGWGPAIGDLRSYQLGLLGRRGVSSGQFGLVLPVGWDRPLDEVFCSLDEHCPPDLHCMGHLCVCSSDEDCPPDLFCFSGGCVGPNHNPSEGAWIDATRGDFVLVDLGEVIQGIGTEFLDYLYFAVGVERGGVPDPGEARYAGTLLLEVSDDACGRFTFGLDAEDPRYPGVGRTLFVNNDADAVSVYTRPLVIETPSCDCNNNFVRDDEEISAGGAFDCDGDGVLDQCEPDCNVNGVPDDCDLADCADEVWCEDCNSNGVLDECDIADGTLTDADGNGVPDSCFIPIPTVSQWGLVAMTLILLTTSKILFRRRRAALWEGAR